MLVNLLRRGAFFRVEARTEILEVTLRTSLTSQLADLHWIVDVDSVLVDDKIIAPFHGRVVPAAGARIVMRRAGASPLYLEVHASTDTAIAAVLEVDDNPIATARTLLVLRAARPFA